MLVIRFFRTGKKNQSFFKIVVTDKRRAARGGRFIEEVGYVNPLTKKFKVNGERAKYWISVGAKPSDRVHNLLISQKVIEGKKIASFIPKAKVEATVAEPVKPAVVEAPAEQPVVEEVKPAEEENKAPEAEKTE